MRVSPIQRMAGIVLIVVLVFWFYGKQKQRFNSNFPLISGVEQTIYSMNPEADKFFLEKVMEMEVLDVKFNEILFLEGIILKSAPMDRYTAGQDSLYREFSTTDTIQLRTRRMKDLWTNITASTALIISAPDRHKDESIAYFKLPGGTVVRLIGRR